MAKKYAFMLLAVSLLLPAGAIRAQASIDIGFFYDSLAPYGEWISVEPYGWVWSPYNVSPGWRPYSDGYWTYTDFGWTWVSNNDWGWAACHYGRWSYDDLYGWIWVPGATWGPAWVAWRYGDGYVGWAPLPPDVAWQGAGGLDWGGFNFDVGFQWYWWNFTDERWLSARHLHRHIFPSDRNINIINRTKNITRYGFTHDRIMDHGLDIDRFEHATHQKVPRLKVAGRESMDGMRRARVHGHSLMLFRPRISNAGIEKAPPHSIMHRRLNPRTYKHEMQKYHRHQINRMQNQENRMKNRQHTAPREEMHREHQRAMGAVRDHQQREMHAYEHRMQREQERRQQHHERMQQSRELRRHASRRENRHESGRPGGKRRGKH